MDIQRMDRLKDLLVNNISRHLDVPTRIAFKAALPIAIELEALLQRELAEINRPVPEPRKSVKKSQSEDLNPKLF